MAGSAWSDTVRDIYSLKISYSELYLFSTKSPNQGQAKYAYYKELSLYMSRVEAMSQSNNLIV